MFIFLAPLLIGFVLDLASAFTTRYARILGERGGRIATFVLRVLLGIPLWVLGLSIAVRTTSPYVFPPSMASDLIGRLLGLLSSVVVIWGLLSLGIPAAIPSLHDVVVRHSIYGRIRHPIYSGAMIGFIAVILLKPTSSVVIACALGVVWLVLQARCEEFDLLQRSADYQEYMEQVPRFLPRIGRR
jgi:protein-S-isoprenylcysteine O-methyltransferase Ste14